MRSGLVAGSAALVLLLGCAPGTAQGQRVIVVAEPARSVPSRAVVVRRERPRALVIVRLQTHGNRGRASHAWWRHNGYRPVEVYYVGGRYYDRWDGDYRGVRRVYVYERGGRLYRDWDDDRYGRDDRFDRDDRYDRDNRDDRYDRGDRSDRDDRYDERSDRARERDRTEDLRRNRDWTR